MALDHYVAQTYLGQWCDRKTGRKLQAYRKSTGKQFACWPDVVCAQKNDDLNPYLTKRDTLGQYRALWEPFWNRAVEGFRRREFTGDNKFVLALGWASMLATTPTSSGIGAEVVKNELRSLIPIIARPPPPGIRLEDLSITVDPKFAQALFTQTLPRVAWRLYVQPWTLLTNATDELFLTSDNPSAAFGQDNMGTPPARMLPLAPDLCVTTLMDFKLAVPNDFQLADLTTRPCGGVRPEAATLEQARFVNSLTVKHAGDIVLSSQASEDVAALVEALQRDGVRLDYTADSLEGTKALLAVAKVGIDIVR
ncbi:DUF4238 domain-containing protein [Bradyrhizobium canariense]|uniref:DUF4238 domain-containing protein n=1 Tax=Bradyrhizobium canariense TaxID=255045 RepID=A0A1H2AV11_9BRAD|nr:DUF4238 domain-containing protein [Bradyrhizobium canariense]SDT49808.1 Protein of unknown function [Bradyrhizobium canariense]